MLEPKILFSKSYALFQIINCAKSLFSNGFNIHLILLFLSGYSFERYLYSSKCVSYNGSCLYVIYSHKYFLVVKSLVYNNVLPILAISITRRVKSYRKRTKTHVHRTEEIMLHI